MRRGEKCSYNKNQDLCGTMFGEVKLDQAHYTVVWDTNPGILTNAPTPNNQHIIYHYYFTVGMLTYFQSSMSLKTRWYNYMIFRVAYRYNKINIDYRKGYIDIYIDIYRDLGFIFLRSLPLYIEIYRAGDNRRTVDTSTFLISWGLKTHVKHCYVDLSS